MNDYLWSGEGPPDPEIRDLEKRLRPYGAKPQKPLFAEEVQPRRRLRRLLVAAAVFMMVLGAAVWGTWPLAVGPYFLHEVQGDVRIHLAEGGVRSDDTWVLEAGDRVTVGPESSARIRVGFLGWVVIAPNSVAQIGEPKSMLDGAYNVRLERGELEALIRARARFFHIGTPAGDAVDYGCRFTVQVDDEGSTRLQVDDGRVQFENEHGSACVPMGASTSARRGRPPATPVWNGTAPNVCGNLKNLDDPTCVTPDLDVKAIFSAMGERDTLPLWHLLAHSNRIIREGALQRLEELGALPDDVDRDALRRRDEYALLSLRDSLGWWLPTP